MQLTTEQTGQMVLDILQQGFHTPIVNGKCNEDNIHEELTIGILAGVLPPMDEDDADMIIGLVNDMIKNYGVKNDN